MYRQAEASALFGTYADLEDMDMFLSVVCVIYMPGYTDTHAERSSRTMADSTGS
jgi:hypothetical protein